MLIIVILEIATFILHLIIQIHKALSPDSITITLLILMRLIINFISGNTPNIDVVFSDIQISIRIQILLQFYRILLFQS